jgi:hypothetical protein
VLFLLMDCSLRRGGESLARHADEWAPGKRN